ncbi:GNAT family N-acetyltransferase [Sphingomonas ginkgonis]|uniref:GNAT family N-acetyltransferase n=1 Tax=Sphingomonas ginkgonis TaxID=2315330 RepID=A0A429VEC2_9SPHN|nr:GNAT family N-acetyltransferase [Sphingomonas ginkgonis]
MDSFAPSTRETSALAERHLRPVTPDDLDLISGHRRRMFLENGRPPRAVDAAEGPFREWLRRHLADGSYFGWIVEQDGASVAGCGMMAIEWPPHPIHPDQDRRGYVLNVYVEPGHRGEGHARALMERCCGEARRRGLRYVILHATAQGRPLYEKLGWEDTAEMALVVLSEEE